MLHTGSMQQRHSGNKNLLSPDQPAQATIRAPAKYTHD
jgi:hypothetical protein